MMRTNQLLQRCMQYPILSGEEKFPERTKTIIEDRIVCGPRERLEAYMLGVHQIQIMTIFMDENTSNCTKPGEEHGN